MKNLVYVLTLIVLGSGPVLSQDSRDEIIRSEGDRFPIHATYYPASEDSNPSGTMNAPVVVFLHGDNGARLQWDKGSAPRGATPFPAELQKRGFAAITVDLRKHGESIVEGSEQPVRPNDYRKMVVGDLAAVKKFIFEEHQKQRLNMNKMAIVAIGFSAPVAAGFAEVDWKQVPYDDAALAADRTPRGQDVQALILISPETSAGTVIASRSLTFLRQTGLSLMVIAGAQDRKAKKSAESLHQIFAAMKGAENRSEIVLPDLKDNGLPLLVKAPSATLVPMLKFLDEKVKDRESVWKDRRSRLER